MHPDLEKLVEADASSVNGRLSPEILDELAALSVDEYEPQRKSMAEKYGWRVSTLDREVEQRRPQNGNGKPLQGTALTFPEILPAVNSVDGDILLTALMNLFERYIVFPSSACLTVVLWIIRAFAHELFRFNPLLLINSPEMRCGKTTLLEIISLLVPRPLLSSNCSPAVVFRVIEKYWPTLMIDEFDSFGDMHEELRGILNSGHKQGSWVLRCEGDGREPRMFHTCTPTTVAMIGTPPPTVRDRSLEIPMQRKKKTDRVQRFPRKGLEWERFRQECVELQRQILRWVEDHTEALQQANSQPIHSLSDRAQDNWDSLLAIVEVIGGEWPRLAQEAAVQISGTELDAETVGVMLLTDIRQVFDAQDEERLGSQHLCDALTVMEERPWCTWVKGKPMSPNQLARQLGKFRIVSRNIRTKTGVLRGYLKEHFEEAWDRYCPASPVNPDS